jgi:hypothetical protein
MRSAYRSIVTVQHVGYIVNDLHRRVRVYVLEHTFAETESVVVVVCLAVVDVVATG